MVHLEQTTNAVVFAVRAHAGARRNGITGVHNGALKVAVTAAAEKGKANQAIAELLCEALALRRGQLNLISGSTSSQKRFAVSGLERADLERKIAAAIAAISK